MASASVPCPRHLEEEEKVVTQECMKLLPSLPREKGWAVRYFYQYQGCWHSSKQLQGTIACQKQFKAQDTDIFLVSTPKAGTTWLKAMGFAIANRAHYDKNDNPLLVTNPHELVPYLEFDPYGNNKYPDFSNLIPPRLLSTHLPYPSLPESIKDSKSKIVYLCRNPRDTFISLWHFTNKFRPKTAGPNSLEDVFDLFCRGVSLYGPFWDHVMDYWKASLASPERILFLKYEEIKRAPSVILTRLAEFMGYPFSPEEEKSGVVDGILKLCSFENLSSLQVNKTGKLKSGEEGNGVFFRRGEVGDWENYLTPEMLQRIDRIAGQKLNGSGLEL